MTASTKSLPAPKTREAAPLVALITPNRALSRQAVARLIEEGHDVGAIAEFYRGGNSRARSVSK